MADQFSNALSHLPIQAIIPEVQQHLSEGRNVLVSASPGAGKSTLLPLALLNEPWLAGKKILLLEPRRLAATSIAKRMASLLNEPLGQRIGYSVRFESKIAQQNQLVVVTEGILTRMVQEDNALEAFGLIIFDEFHERSIHADVALTFCLETQQILRPDLRIMAMSATLDVPNLADFLKAPVIVCPTHSFPVGIHYTDAPDIADLPIACARLILQVLREKTGDILVFLPGQGSIKRCKELLGSVSRDVVVHMLFGQLSLEAQTAALLPDPKGRRKIVLATSIAETSLTIIGVQVVIDSGFTRKARFDAKTGLSSLITVRIGLDAAAQRAGRAGRTGPGTCYRMWTKGIEAQMPFYRQPEILEADLMPLALDLLHWGILHVEQLRWLTPPPIEQLQQAQANLTYLGILENGKITKHGKAVHKLACHPRIGHLLLKAKAAHALPLAVDLAAILEERDPLNLPHEAAIDLRLAAVQRARTTPTTDKHLHRIIQAAATYRHLFRADTTHYALDAYQCGRLIAYAYPDRVASSLGTDGQRFMMANGRKVTLSPHESHLLHEPWLAIAQADIQSNEGKIFLAAPIRKDDLMEASTQHTQVSWDTQRGGLIAQKEWKYGGLVLQSKPIIDPPQALVNSAILGAVRKEGVHLLSWDTEVVEWQNRIQSLRFWNPTDGWPLVTTEHLLEYAASWLLPYLNGIKRVDELKKLSLVSILHHTLPYEQQQQLERLAPTHIQVPSGSNIKLEYQALGEPPILAVRLQEVFGLLDTPCINAGKNSVVLHLLSPGYKAVQITSDLRSFWEHTYFEVRKELKRRYPKHAWPDNPLVAQAIKGVKRRNS